LDWRKIHSTRTNALARGLSFCRLPRWPALRRPEWRAVALRRRRERRQGRRELRVRTKLNHGAQGRGRNERRRSPGRQQGGKGQRKRTERIGLHRSRVTRPPPSTRSKSPARPTNLRTPTNLSVSESEQISVLESKLFKRIIFTRRGKIGAEKEDCVCPFRRLQLAGPPGLALAARGIVLIWATCTL